MRNFLMFTALKYKLESFIKSLDHKISHDFVSEQLCIITIRHFHNFILQLGDVGNASERNSSS